MSKTIAIRAVNNYNIFTIITIIFCNIKNQTDYERKYLDIQCTDINRRLMLPEREMKHKFLLLNWLSNIFRILNRVFDMENIASKVSLFGVILVLVFQHYFRISPYLVQMPENTDPNNSKYRHFSRRENFISITRLSICFWINNRFIKTNYFYCKTISM